MVNVGLASSRPPPVDTSHLAPHDRRPAHRALRLSLSPVPALLVARAVRPTRTPMAVTLPGEHRHTSMLGIVNMAPPPRAARASSSVAAPPFAASPSAASA